MRIGRPRRRQGAAERGRRGDDARPAFHRRRRRNVGFGSLCAGQRQAELSARGDQARHGHPAGGGAPRRHSDDHRLFRHRRPRLAGRSLRRHRQRDRRRERVQGPHRGRLFGADPGIPARPDEGGPDPRARPGAASRRGRHPQQRARRRHDGRRAAAARHRGGRGAGDRRPLLRLGAVCRHSDHGRLSGRARLARRQGHGVRHAGLRQSRARHRRGDDVQGQLHRCASTARTSR